MLARGGVAAAGRLLHEVGVELRAGTGEVEIGERKFAQALGGIGVGNGKETLREMLEENGSSLLNECGFEGRFVREVVVDAGSANSQAGAEVAEGECGGPFGFEEEKSGGEEVVGGDLSGMGHCWDVSGTTISQKRGGSLTVQA